MQGIPHYTQTHKLAKCSKPRERARSKTGLNVEVYCWLLGMALGLALGGIKAAAEQRHLSDASTPSRPGSGVEVKK